MSKHVEAVAEDLMKRGHEVFVRVSDKAVADLVVALGPKGGDARRVRIKKGTYKLGKPWADVVRTENGTYDVLAIVLPKGKIAYEPPLKESLEGPKRKFQVRAFVRSFDF